MRTFGQMVKEARLSKGRTLEQVARWIKCHKGYVSGIEGGKVAAPSAKLVRRLGRYLGLDPQRLLALAWWEKRPPALTVTDAHLLLSDLREEEAKAAAIAAEGAAGSGAGQALGKAV